MTPNNRKLFALLSACGLAVSILAYMATIFESGPEATFRLAIILIPVWMVLFVPIPILEYPESRSLSFSLKGFWRGMPKWVAPCSWIIILIALAHFIWFAVHSGWGVPAVMDGQYVLDARGTILKVLTRAEYINLRADGGRVIATFMIYFYFMTLAYWWFPRIPQAGT